MSKITISCGNRKLDKSIGIFNLPAVISCPNHNLCEKTCYAKKAERIYESARISRANNYEASSELSFVEKAIIAIEKSKKSRIRMHESGDFYSQHYANKWSLIASKLPNIYFYAFSKSPFLPSPQPNLHIIKSILPDGELNYGSKEYVERLHQKYGFFICTMKAGSGRFCGKDCTYCFDNHPEYVLFIKH